MIGSFPVRTRCRAAASAAHWQETFADSVRRLCRDGLDEALADLFVRATLLVNLGPHGVGHADAAQAARAFLFARLESYAATKGLFRENVRVPIPCGTNPFLEVDLLAEKGRLAIRLDAMGDRPWMRWGTDPGVVLGTGS